jgi:hypothetical protein
MTPDYWADLKGWAFFVKRTRYWPWPVLLVLILFATGYGEQAAGSEGGIVATQTMQPTASPTASPTATPKPAG